MGGGGKGKVEVTIGYKYYAGLHMVFCDAADRLLAIAVGDKIAWTGNVYSNTTITINKPDLFGGEGREGGIQGNVDVMFGKDNQGQNEYLRNKLGSDIPAFRGVVSLVGKQLYLSALNPYIKPWKARFSRFPDLEGSFWGHYHSNINGNANPAHIIHEVILKNGLGPTDINSFENVARKLHEENLGISIAWTGGSIEDFIQTILNHISGVLFVNPTTGKFEIKLIRNDYNIDSLMVLDESSIKELVSYQRIALSDTINQLTVYYTDFETGDERSVTVQNLANIAAQGKVVTDERKYLGITNLTTATQLAMRDLKASSSMLSKLTIKVNRKAFELLPGDVFVFKWPKLGIERMVFRVGEINYGTLTDGTITIDAIEDVYSLPEASYIETPIQYWEDPVKEPSPCPHQKMFEVPYYDLVRSLPPADFDYLPKNSGIGYVGAVGSRPSGSALNYEFYTATSSSGTYTHRDTETFCPVAFLASSVGYTEDTWQITNGTDLDLVVPGNTQYAIVDDEIIRIDDISSSGTSIDVKRGCLDTVVKPHQIGAVIFFVSGWQTVDQTERISGQTVYGKLLTRTGKGLLSLQQAEYMRVKLSDRFDRPYPPAGFKINNVLYPDGLEMEGKLTLSWKHRDRTQQTAYIVGDNEGSIGPEEGTTYTVEIRRASNNTFIYKKENITDNTTTIQATDINVDTTIFVDLWSVRDGYDSWQKHRIPIEYYRAPRRIDQNGEIRTTEDGIIRITEG